MRVVLALDQRAQHEARGAWMLGAAESRHFGRGAYLPCLGLPLGSAWRGEAAPPKCGAHTHNQPCQPQEARVASCGAPKTASSSLHAVPATKGV